MSSRESSTTAGTLKAGQRGANGAPRGDTQNMALNQPIYAPQLISVMSLADLVE